LNPSACGSREMFTPFELDLFLEVLVCVFLQCPEKQKTKASLSPHPTPHDATHPSSTQNRKEKGERRKEKRRKGLNLACGGKTKTSLLPAFCSTRQLPQKGPFFCNICHNYNPGRKVRTGPFTHTKRKKDNQPTLPWCSSRTSTLVNRACGPLE